MLRNVGAVSPEAYAAAEDVSAAVETARIDWTFGVNQRIRKLLEDREVAPCLIEEVIDQVMIGVSAED